MKKSHLTVLPSSRMLKSALPLLGLVAFSLQDAPAATRTWIGASGGSINSAANWSGSAVPTTGDTALWDGTVAGNLTLTISSALGTNSTGVTLNVAGSQTSSVTVNATNSGVIFRTANITVDSGAGAFTIGATGANSYRMLLQSASGPTHTFTNNSSNTTVLTSSGTIEGNNTAQDLVFTGSGNWQVNSTIIASNMRAVTKNGTGTLILTGSNSYSGTTSVNAGTLLVNNVAGSATGTNTVAVAAGAAFGGTGSVAGPVTVSGTLTPGDTGSQGLLTVLGPLTLSGNAANSDIQIVGASRGLAGGYDAVNVGASQLLTYDGTLTFTMTALVADGTYDIFSFTSGFDAGGLDGVAFAGGAYSGVWTESGVGTGVWSATSGGQTFTFNEATGDLVVAVPEPSAVLLCGLGSGLILWRSRRKRISL